MSIEFTGSKNMSKAHWEQTSVRRSVVGAGCSAKSPVLGDMQ